MRRWRWFSFLCWTGSGAKNRSGIFLSGKPRTSPQNNPHQLRERGYQSGLIIVRNVPNLYKIGMLESLRERFGELHKLTGSESLYAIGKDSARIYIRYSKVHPGGRTFFGLREADLRQLEGHNSFLCFLVDDAAPLFLPYEEFEEVFRNAETANDGQYKVQLYQGGSGVELYVARQGRFNVEGYIGLEPIARSLDDPLAREARALTHAQVQTLLAGIGRLKNYGVYVPERDVGCLDWTLTERFGLRRTPPSGFERIRGILSEIDVVWVASGGEAVEGLFEVEHSTTVYSGLLRFNDMLLTDSKLSRFSIVSNESRRALFSRQIFRPTFQKSGLADRTSFLEYSNVLEWHRRLITGNRRATRLSEGPKQVAEKTVEGGRLLERVPEREEVI